MLKIIELRRKSPKLADICRIWLKFIEISQKFVQKKEAEFNQPTSGTSRM